MSRKRLAAPCAIVSALLLCTYAPGLGASPQADRHAAEMAVHHLHILLNEGISMVAEGSDLVMLAGMQTTPALDRPTLRHGQEMIADGRGLIRRVLDGPEMSALAAEGKAPASLLGYSRELGDAMRLYMQRLERLDVDRMSSPRNATLQRMNIVLNHALKMASDGANLVMVARMGMAGPVDRLTREQGERLISQARGLCREVLEGEAMQRLREMEGGREPSAMRVLTQELGASVVGIIEQLDRMPDVTGNHGTG